MQRHAKAWRVRHEKTFEERLAEEAIRFREAAKKQSPGRPRPSTAPAACPAGRDGCSHQRLATVPRVASAKVSPSTGGTK
jgi:hypothetical protein